MSVRLLALAAAFLAVSGSNVTQAEEVHIVLQSLRCNKQTEGGGDDEPYLVVSGLAPGGKFTRRLPENGHWSITDDGAEDTRKVNGVSLWRGDLKPGESIEITVLVMEEDDGTPPKVIKKIGEEIAGSIRTDDKAVGAVIAVGKTLLGLLKNSDDYIGSFSGKVSNSGGKLKMEWKANERGIKTTDTSPSGDTGKFGLNGDGSQYDVWISPWLVPVKSR